ncbi:MAG: hypothetical protein JSW06_09725 [Thermoplasmatales archaeon]|nr:MAG: hypothetical protein JSW06_09725 [Thermoplasmatales archaeon]
MNKKILLVSIISVVILILVSFTSVIGYRSISSDVKVSPLFNMRISRAIDRDSKDIVCDYVGKGEEGNLFISKRNVRMASFQKGINIINKMDDKVFNEFVIRIILRLKNQEGMTGKETSNISQALQNIRRNPNDLKYDNTKNILNTIITCVDTLDFITSFQFPCIILTIISILWELYSSIFAWITSYTCYNLPTEGCYCIAV